MITLESVVSTNSTLARLASARMELLALTTESVIHAFVHPVSRAKTVKMTLSTARKHLVLRAQHASTCLLDSIVSVRSI